MHKLAYSILITLIFTSISSPVLAEGRAPHNARLSRQAAIVNAQKQDAASCRIFDSTGRLLSEVEGGRTAFCSVVPR